MNWDGFKVKTQNTKLRDKQMGNMKDDLSGMGDRTNSSKICILGVRTAGNVKNGKNIYIQGKN